MNEKIRDYLKSVVATELKWMYHYETTDEDFDEDLNIETDQYARWLSHYEITGKDFVIETDQYARCMEVLKGNRSVKSLIDYFIAQYGESESVFLATLRDLGE